MKLKSLFLVFIIFLQLGLPAFSTGLEDDVLSSLDDIKNILQHSNNKFLSTFTGKVNSIIDTVNKAISDLESDCSSEIGDVILQLNDLSSKIKKRKCKKSKNKKSQCVPISTADDIVLKISNVSDLLSPASNSDEVPDICLNSDFTSSGSTSSDSTSCLVNNEPEQNTDSTTQNDDVIIGCDQNEVLNFENILNSNKLTLSSSAMVDTKLDLGNIEFYKYSLNMGDIYIAKNTSSVPSEVMVSLDESTNVSSDIHSVISLSPKSQKYGFKVCVVDSSMSWSYNYSFKDEIGFSTNVYTGDGKYFLPFKAGESYAVTQGEMGTFSHFGDFLYSIDFGMPEGTEVTAMRNGTVVFIKEGSNEGGPDKSFLDKANFIWVLHVDGSIGRYVHLKQNGALVNLGDKVKVGDVIGYSGNTGYTQGPHLHVQVVLPKGFSGEEKIPIRFNSIDGALVEHESYTALPICK
ncbi:MAG: M23 family metallopeptidase [Candidatus Melainabacteria bacterium]|nr:M23 family metallopeptidase [Candidatus Melainabacteria bacterium]